MGQAYGAEEFLNDAAPELGVEHFLEGFCGVRITFAEIEVVQALDKVLDRQLMDVLLKGKVDALACK